jgi:hypothetical protein
MIDASVRLAVEVRNLIAQEQYFVIHAARQTGKTTLLLDTTRRLNAEGEYYALYCSLENIYVAPDPAVGIPATISTIRNSLDNYGRPHAEAFGKGADMSDVLNVLGSSLRNYCRLLDKPLVIFFDEADCLSDDMLLSFLRQLRNGYVNRGVAPFPVSVALVGMRNLRDY